MYKVIAKVLANRLRSILPGIITDNQSAFVPGRNIADNVLVTFEILHHMKRMRRGAEREVALKLDVSKAYDRVDWSYLRKRLIQMGFESKWINWIFLCVTTVSYSVGVNGVSVGPIIPRRGLRQGDPLSPYLFLFCADGLSDMINKEALENKISGSQIASNAPAVTHLLFADDSFLFFKPVEEEAQQVKLILQMYEAISGQAINLQKSGICFSSNVRVDKQQQLKQQLGVHKDLSTDKYLGLPAFVGRSKKSIFNYLKDKMWRCIQGWSEKCLSRGGKAVLLRNVAQTIPTYTMSCFLISKSLSQELERMMNSFLWGNVTNDYKGLRWLS